MPQKFRLLLLLYTFHKLTMILIWHDGSSVEEYSTLPAVVTSKMTERNCFAVSKFVRDYLRLMDDVGNVLESVGRQTPPLLTTISSSS